MNLLERKECIINLAKKGIKSGEQYVVIVSYSSVTIDPYRYYISLP